MDFNEINIIINLVPVKLLLLGIFIKIILLVIATIRFNLILNFLKIKTEFIKSFIITNISMFVAYFTPFKGGGFISKPVLTSSMYKCSIKKAVLASTLEPLYDTAWQLILLPILLAIVSSRIIIGNKIVKMIVTLALIFILIFSLKNYQKMLPLIAKVKKFIPKKVRAFLIKRKVTKETMGNAISKLNGYIMNKRFFFYMLIPTLFTIVISPFLITISSNAFGYTIPYTEAFLIVWIAYILGKLSGLPAQIGSRELVLLALFAPLGINVVDGLKIALFYRVVGMLPVIIIGGISLAFVGRKATVSIIKKIRK